MDQGCRAMNGFCVIFVSAFLCPLVCQPVAPVAVAMETGADTYAHHQRFVQSAQS